MSWGDFQKEKLYKSGFNRLRNWKDDGQIDVWIHTNSKFFKRIFIMIPYVAEEEDEKTGKAKRIIKYFPYVSHEETNDFLNRKRNGEYYRCPLLRFTDWLTDNGYIDDDETVFEVSIDDRKRDRICSKADFLGDTKAGGDWKLAMKPSLQYVMAVIDNKNVEDGIVVTAETYSLGEAIKKVVRDRLESVGEEIGDPALNPYCFRWKFNPHARIPGEYYNAIALEREELTDEIKELIDQPGVDIDNWIIPGDVDFLRKIFEEHITIDNVPWDDLFNNVQEDYSTFGNVDVDEDDVEEQLSKPHDKKPKPKKPNKRTRASSKPKAKIEPEPEDDSVTICPTCKGKGKRRGKKCKVCDGTGEVEVDEDGNEDEEDVEESSEPEPPPSKKNTTKKRGRRARKPTPPPEDDEDMDECGHCNRSVPYDADSCPHCGVSFE